MTWRVLDLTTTLAGAYSAHLLVAAGVDVTRVEPPQGHALRRWSATGAELSPDGCGPMFGWLAGGTSSVVVDPTSESDVVELLQRAAGYDAVTWSPGAVVDIERLRAAVPEVTITALTPFGLDGPWADRVATEFTLQALSGAPGLRGSRAWPPMSAGGQHGEYMIGVFGAVATLIGLRRMLVSGGGGVLDVSGLESVMMTQLFNPHTMETQVGGVRPKRARATVGDVVPTRDGYVGFAVVNRVQHWLDFCAMIGRPDWADDRTLDGVATRTERSAELNPVIEAWCGERTTAEIVELAALLRIPCIEVGNGASIPTMDHFASEPFYDVNPDGGFLQPAAAVPDAPTDPRCRGGPPGAGTRAVDPRHATTAAGTGADAAQRSRPAPVRGLRVADFTSFWAGPFLGHVLGMFGADVVHVESTGRPDGARLMNQHPRTEAQWWERSPYFHATNTNKRGVTLDLAQPDGRALAQRLVAECDVIVENYSPRVMDSFGLSWDDVRAINPAAIMVRMPAFGLSGPWRDRTGFAMTMEQVSGMAWLCGFPEHAPGALFGPCDPGAGLHALTGLLAALEHRRRTGEGRLVECPMVANALNVAGEQVIEHSANGIRLDRTGNRGLAAAPQNCYAASDWDDDLEHHRWVSIAVATDEQWRALRAALGSPAWSTAPALDTFAGRMAAHDDLDHHLAAWCAERKAAEIVDELWTAGVPCAVVVHPSENLTMEQLVHRRLLRARRAPGPRRSLIATFPFRLPDDDGPVHRRPAPLLGEHNGEVLGDLLGVPTAELDRLTAAGVIGTELPD